MKEKKELHLPLSNLNGKNIHRDKNKYLNKWIKKDNNKPLLLCLMSVDLFCNDDRTPPIHPQENKNKTKQNRLTLIC